MVSAYSRWLSAVSGQGHPLRVTFSAGRDGMWRIDRADAIAGEGLAVAERLCFLEGARDIPSPPPAWVV
jgi:hypothetical protein